MTNIVSCLIPERGLSDVHSCVNMLVFLGAAVVADRQGFAPDKPGLCRLSFKIVYIVNGSPGHSIVRDWTALVVLKGMSVAIKWEIVI